MIRMVAAMETEAPARSSELYSRELLRLATSLPHGDRLEGLAANASRRSPVCGSEISADVRLDSAGRIAALAFRARACAMGQASAALLRTCAIGRSVADLIEARAMLSAALAGDNEFLVAWPEHLVFEAARKHPGRHAAILLPFDTVLAALERD